MHIPFNQAEQIKCRDAVVDRDYLQTARQSIKLQYHNEMVTILTEEIYQITVARAGEILNLLKAKLRLTEEMNSFPIVITGGSSNLLGLMNLVGKVFEKPHSAFVRIAKPWNWGGPFDVYDDPSFSGAIGACIAGFKHYLQEGREDDGDLHRNDTEEGIDKKPWLASLKVKLAELSTKFRKFISLGDIE